MRIKVPAIAGLIVVVIAAAALLSAEEKAEPSFAPEPAAIPSADGDWIESVPGETAAVWAVGDANPPNSAKVGRLIRRADPDRVIYLGDVYPEGSLDDFRRWRKPLHGLIRRMAPTPGNHEWDLAGEGYEPFWRQVTGQTPPSHYSFRAGGWQVLSVNSELSDWSETESWLRDQASAGGNCRIAFWHRPRYSAGKYHEGDDRARAYWDALKGGARIILNGHDHNMQRLRSRGGIVEFISGAGGRHRHPVDENDRLLAFSDDKHFGALRLRLSSERARWRFVTVGGRVLDRGTLFCRS